MRRVEPKAPARPATKEDFTGILSKPHIGIFCGVDETFIDGLIASDECSVVTYLPGEDVFCQNDRTGSLAIWIVISGLFAVKHNYETAGETLIVAFDAAATVIGEVERLIFNVPDPLISRGIKANFAKATITAMMDSKVLKIEGHSRNDFMQNCVVSQNMNRLLALKLLRRSARGDAIKLYEPHEVVAALIKRLALEPELGGVGVQEQVEAGALKDYVRLNCRIEQSDWGIVLDKNSGQISAMFTRLEAKKMVAYRRGVLYINKRLRDGATEVREGLDFSW